MFWGKTIEKMRMLKLNLPPYDPLGGTFIFQNGHAEMLLSNLDSKGVMVLVNLINDRLVKA